MTSGAVRVSPAWLALREPADAAARSPELAEAAASRLPADGPVRIYDLGCGTGSMGRWLAPRLSRSQHWVLYDWDADLLGPAVADMPVRGAAGTRVTAESRHGDVSRLGPDDLADAGLITASALLDLMTAEELRRWATACTAAGCPALVTLSVTGLVELTPADPLDQPIGEAFNEHQRRTVAGRSLLGPDAVEVAVQAFRQLGAQVLVRPSPWRLGSASAQLAASWCRGWVAAACEQRPELAGAAEPYLARRLTQAREGRLGVTVQHLDLLALPG